MTERLYEVFVADTEFARTINYHVRYQVYCEQKQYEAPNAEFIDLERDEWDDRSVHFIARERSTGEWCAALRLVKPSFDEVLPLEQVSQIDHDRIQGKRHQAVELSRLCKPKTGDTEACSQGSGGAEVVQTLISSAARYCRDHGYLELFCLTSPSIVRLMPRSWGFTPVGPATLHRGLRRPYWLDIDSILSFYDDRAPQADYRSFSHAFGGSVLAAAS
ncbi:GNAT family N-acyltransferase [Aestuariirhabdus litorea]|uniref:GNAT family N-acetyltransferase n=1 Tax=Aestuariirhabdus litorea TaxID=2528527 RepID=A0A3P3VP85_9GAMM|nr:GNAT family N-acyltransferase [Aestuariirhabdus litorea]RRJ84581.1 GNAT family N-acetyltransferase [Aestuariirhabdus litorea]RWW97807.1 GNAT family N-acetyltransferase [Endozoicomonadaceae bacterium GTF-13]